MGGAFYDVLKTWCLDRSAKWLSIWLRSLGRKRTSELVGLAAWRTRVLCVLYSRSPRVRVDVNFE